MRLIRTAEEIRTVSSRLRRRGRSLGLVPTMGALHEGHASLIRASASQCDATIVTIFVNPLQFGPQEDCRRYPRTLAHDRRIADAAGAGVFFVPGVDQIYPERFQTFIDVGPLAQRWEGQGRPGHFRGVATVVTRLFALTQPTHAFFGQKDYQQALIIRRLIEDLEFRISFRLLPTVREADGLAMSSRNRYLSAAHRRQAPAIYQALCHARRCIRAGERRAEAALREMRRLLRAQPDLRLDYVAVVDATTLVSQRRLRGRVALLVAARLGATRLIDNLLVDVS